MSEERRIRRAFDRAERSFAALRSTSNPYKQQGAWEEFLIDWRHTLELLRKLCELQGEMRVRESFHVERLESPVLNYMWEARNAEYHDPRGSAEATGEFFMLSAADPDELTVIENLELHRSDYMKGFERAKIANSSLIVAGRVDLQPVKTAKRIIDPPSSANLVECAAEALRYAQRFLEACRFS